MNKSKSQVQFHFLHPCSLPDRKALKSFILTIFRKKKLIAGSVNIIFCDDDYLLKLNRQFLQHDFYTDILSFPLSDKGVPLEGEIYISVERVRENAKMLKTSAREELLRVIFHGILHFCGYQDKSASDQTKMRSMENRYLKAYLNFKAAP
jgi:probable rRNA maturation factor